ncbi:hypothetical protein BGZ98_006050, partial [Dissophora globulifera]
AKQAATQSKLRTRSTRHRDPAPPADTADQDLPNGVQSAMDVDDDELLNYNEEDEDDEVLDSIQQTKTSVAGTPDAAPDAVSVSTDADSAFEESMQEMFEHELSEAKGRYREALRALRDSGSPSDQALAEFELGEVRLLEARGYKEGFLTPVTTVPTAVSVNQHKHSHSAATEPKVISFKDVRWKDVPRWDKSWKTKDDVDVFLDQMSDFQRQITDGGRLELAHDVANQCWLTSIKNLGGQSAVLAAQIRRAKTWVEMEKEFKAWFSKLDSNPPTDFDGLAWEEDVSLPQFCQVFATSAQVNGL